MPWRSKDAKSTGVLVSLSAGSLVVSSGGVVSVPVSSELGVVSVLLVSSAVESLGLDEFSSELSRVDDVGGVGGSVSVLPQAVETRTASKMLSTLIIMGISA